MNQRCAAALGRGMEGEMVSLMAQTLSTLSLAWPFLEVALHEAAHQ